MTISFLVALIAIADGQGDMSTVEEFEDEISCNLSYQYEVYDCVEPLEERYAKQPLYEVLTADSLNDPKLASAQASDYVTDNTVDDWVNDPKALMFEFTAAQNQDLISIKFQDNGESEFLFNDDADMPTAADGDGIAQTLNFLDPQFALKIDDPEESTDVYIGHSWFVPREAVAGDVYWGGIKYTKVGSVERYLSVKVNIVLPFIFDGSFEQEDVALATSDEFEILDLSDPGDLSTINRIGWVLEGGPYPQDEVSITAGDGNTISWCIGKDIGDHGQSSPYLQPLSIDANTAGPDYANVCALEWVGHVRSLHPGFNYGPVECFTYKVPMEADNEEKCYAAFSATFDGDTHYFALVANIEGPENFELNEPWLAELPYSAAGFTVEETYDDTTRFWSHWYKRALTGSDSATVSYTRQSGQYVAFSFKKSGVRLELESANEED